MMQNSIFIILVVQFTVLFNSVLRSESARILAVFPIPSISHQVVFRPITQELAGRGHEVVVVTTDPAFPKGQTPKNLTEIDVHDLSYDIWRKNFYVTSTGKKEDINEQLVVAFKLTRIIIEKQIKEESLARIIENERNNFDLLLIEAMARPALVFSHLFKVPTILVSSFGGFFGNFESVGMPTHYSLYPSLLRQKLNNLTLWDKIVELHHVNKLQRAYENLEDEENEMIKRNFGADTPSISEIKNNVDMLFLNTYPIWDCNRPVPPSVIYMGGLHQKPKKEIPMDLKKYLDSSKNGVIYISFGTNVSPSLLPSEKIQLLIKVFSKLPYDVLWKWDKDVLPGQSSNIRIGKWFPQSDLLRHPNIKLFITQGGLQSTDEAVTANVPLLGVPMLGDQWYNVEMYVKHKIGKRVDMETLTEKQFKNAILEIINDESYKRNIDKLRSVMVDSPIPPLENAIWWIEHVLRHGGAKHLRSPAANISWSEFIELPLLLTLLGLASAAAITVLLMVYFVWSFVSKKILLKEKTKRS